MSKVYDDTNVPEKPANGSIINGPFLEGCRWNDETELLDESAPKELYTPMPCIWLKPCLAVDYDPPNVYNCPLYKTSIRASTLSTTGHSTNFVIELKIPSKKPETYWINRGSALLCMLDT